jgi:DNA-binding MarR family transcriptional regulator
VSPLEPDQLDAWRAFLNAHAHVTRAIGSDLTAAGLPDLGWYDLLWTLYRAPERRLRVNELAREVVLSPTAMSRFVDRVEAAGYVRREPDPADRRAHRITVTERGTHVLTVSHRRMVAAFAGALAGWTEEEVVALAEQLDRLRADFARAPEPPDPQEIRP